MMYVVIPKGPSLPVWRRCRAWWAHPPCWEGGPPGYPRDRRDHHVFLPGYNGFMFYGS